MPGFGGSKPTAVPVKGPQAVMPGMNSLFQSLFGDQNGKGGGAGAQGVKTLQDAAAGQGAGASSVTPEMLDAIRKSASNDQKTGFGQIQNSFAASGMSMSTDMMKALSDYNVNFGAKTEGQIQNLMFQGSESAKQRQMQAGGILEETFANAGMAFAPSEVIGTQGLSNAGGAAAGAGASIIEAMILASAM